MIALYKGKSIVSRLIRWRTWSEYSHAAWVCEDGTILDAWQKGGVRHVANISVGHKPGTPVEFFTLYLTPMQRGMIECFLKRQVGKKYDWHGVLKFISRRKTTADQQKKWFCSELISAAFNHARRPLLVRIRDEQVSPGLLAISPLLKRKSIVYTRGKGREPDREQTS